MRKSSVERNAAWLVSIFDKRQAKEEAFLRAQVAQQYSSRSSAELWNWVAATIEDERNKTGWPSKSLTDNVGIGVGTIFGFCENIE